LRWGSRRGKTSRAITYPLEEGRAEKIDTLIFTAKNVKLLVGRKLSDGLWVRSPKRDGCHGGPDWHPARTNGRGFENSCEVVMKRKLLLAVVWIALGGGIVALIIFPPNSVLTAEFRH
jgi:hypothetical protein